MSQSTIQAGPRAAVPLPAAPLRPLGTLAARRPLGLLAAVLLAIEALAALLGGVPPLTALVLVSAPGFALLPLLPRSARESGMAAIAFVPALGFAASAVVLITIASVGLELDPVPVRVGLALVVAAGLALPGRDPSLRGRARPGGWELLGLGAAVAAGAWLQGRVVSGTPIPGSDWGKYALYADEIRRQGSLLIDNPYWMLGMPFREDPAVPALYGSFLRLADLDATAVLHGIWAFTVIVILSVYGFARSLWGPLAGVLAAAFTATLPISQEILGWHGLANAAALTLVPLLLLYGARLLDGALDVTESVGLGLCLVGLAAAHRLSLLVGLGAFGLVVVVALYLGRGRRRALIVSLGRAAFAGAVLGAGVAYDLITRGRTFGGTPGYENYEPTKVDLWPVAKDLALPFTAAALVATFLALRWCRRDRRLIPVLCLLAVVIALAYSWIVHFPLTYIRMAYYLPLALSPLVAVALVKLLRPRHAAVAGTALALTASVFAYDQTTNVRDFYSFLTPASLRGLDALSARLEPGEVVVTDRCWSFVGTWVLHTRTLPALRPEDIQPAAELPFARRARGVLAGTPEGRRAIRRLGVRYAIADPVCFTVSGERARPPKLGRPLFVSKRLVVLELTPG
jgi:hypothetical protein